MNGRNRKMLVCEGENFLKHGYFMQSFNLLYFFFKMISYRLHCAIQRASAFVDKNDSNR